jgi:2-polyprenyl-3-methyl-5-hydroxy-6-metoxy-1,4-benzoquinol methylase
VTSDIKPWPAGGRLRVCRHCGAGQKPDDSDWRREIGDIYRAYDIYHQSGGREQAVFDPALGRPTLRSDRVLSALEATTGGLAPEGRLLDVGCGKGALLSAAAERAPGWRLYGQDLSDSAAPALQKIPGFRRLFVQPLETLSPGFDIVSMIHALEHFPDPVAALSAAAALTTDDGLLLVQVPDAERNPFDLAVADHRTHFTKRSLAALAARCDLEPLLLSAEAVPKELTLIARRRKEGCAPVAAKAPSVADDPGDWAAAHVAVLSAYAALAAQPPQDAVVGVFGTAVAAVWLYGTAPGRVSFFVDEDPARIGGRCFGLPILAPRDVPAGAHLLVPLAPAVAGPVLDRLAALSLRVWTVPTAPPPFPPTEGAVR